MIKLGRVAWAGVTAFSFLGAISLSGGARAAPVCEWLGGPPENLSLLAGPWVYHLRVTSGQKCTGAYGSWNTIYFTRYKNIALDKAPQHGDVTLRANTSVSYQSKRNYKGPDQFTLEVCGEESGRNACTMFTYKLTVD